jgi:hypothetical protein
MGQPLPLFVIQFASHQLRAPEHRRETSLLSVVTALGARCLGRLPQEQLAQSLPPIALQTTGKSRLSTRYILTHMNGPANLYTRLARAWHYYLQRRLR